MSRDTRLPDGTHRFARHELPCPVSGVGQITVIVGEVAKATAFYREMLGLNFLFSAGPAMAFLAAGRARILLTTPQGTGAVGKNSILNFKVADLAAAHAAIVARGAEAASEPRMGAKMRDQALWMAAVRDPEGNGVELMSEARPPRA